MTRGIQWRDSMRSPKLCAVDLRLFVLMLAWAFWPRTWTLVPVLVAMGFLVAVGHKGYRPGAALRALRRWVAGPPRAWSPRRYRRIVDFGVLGLLSALGMAGGGARAEFHYVAPAPADERPSLAIARPVPEDGRIAIAVDGAAPSVAEPERTSAAASTEPTELAPRRKWRVDGGSTLAAILEDWGARANVEVVMLTDREYRIESSHTYTGKFADAVQALLSGLGHLSYAPVGDVFDDGRMLVIRHRAPVRSGVEK